MKKIFKIFFSLIVVINIIFALYMKKNVYANLQNSNMCFEDFQAKSYQRMLFIEDNSVSKSYLMEGTTPSYVIYDYDHNELLYYCWDSYSPWHNYTGNLFNEYGALYINGQGYCIINLEKNNSYNYGDIVNISGPMEAFVYNDVSLADMCLQIIDIPANFDFAGLFPKGYVMEDVEITNSYYFKRLNENIGQNLYHECTLISLAVLLSYFDTFYDDNIIPDQYMNKEIVYNHHIENAISSPGGGKFYEYLLNEKIKETRQYQQYNLDKLGTDPWYIHPVINFGIMTNQLLDLLFDEDSESENSLSKNFELIKFSTSMSADTLENLPNFRSFESLIKMNLPVVVELTSEFDNGKIYPLQYYLSERGEWSTVYGDVGHSFVCYGYLKVYEQTLSGENKILTYYKGHAGNKNDNGEYEYTQAIFSNRLADFDYDGDRAMGYTLIPKKDTHICSKNYIYSNGSCSFGICPCDSKLSTQEFLSKYATKIKIENMDKYICKEHNNHLLYESSHQHQMNYQINDDNHIKYCIIDGCNTSITSYHRTNTIQIHNSQIHKKVCECGYFISEDHSFKHKYAEDLGHYLACIDCGFITRCYLNDYTEIYEQTHGYYCQECQRTYYESHELLYEKIDEYQHRRYCLICGYTEIVPHESYRNELYYITLTNGEVVCYCPCCGFEKIGG